MLEKVREREGEGWRDGGRERGEAVGETVVRETKK